MSKPLRPSLSPTDWLERHWATPSYGGWLLLGLGLCFFGAATNTMAGWLYVLSGIIFALLTLGAWFPQQALKAIELTRPAPAPVSAGEDLTLSLQIFNRSKSPKTLLQLWDLLPPQLGRPQGKSWESIPPQQSAEWLYYQPTQQRGIYHWQGLEIRTGTPLGLFWCRRFFALPTQAIVYPQVLPLGQCPLLDDLGHEDSTRTHSNQRYLAANEGITKTLRPYRYGDSTRLIHWRSSARFDDFQVRELEILTAGRELIIALDNASDWPEADFERAVIAAASLYFYAVRAQLNTQLWSTSTGLVSGSRPVLETLAALQFNQKQSWELPQDLPLLWLTSQPQSLHALPANSRWLLFAGVEPGAATGGLIIGPDEDLGLQLQRRCC